MPPFYKNMSIVLSGYYGYGNLGDEAVLQSILHGLRQINPELKIAVLSHNPQQTRENYYVNAVPRSSLWNVFYAILQADIFISGGGTLLQNSTSRRSFFYYSGLIFLALLLRKKCVVFAQGFGPLRGSFSRFFARFILERCKLITLRDEKSLAAVKELGVKNPRLHLTADPALLIEKPSPSVGMAVLDEEGIQREGKPLLGIILRDLRMGKSHKLWQTLAQAIDWLAQSYDYLPVFILFQPASDNQPTLLVRELMKTKSDLVFHVNQVDKMLALLGQFDLFIGMRLHALVFAATAGIPAAAIAYDPKVTAFMQALEQPFLSLEDAADIEKVKKVLTDVIQNKLALQAAMRSKRQLLCARANLNFELFQSAFPGMSCRTESRERKAVSRKPFFYTAYCYLLSAIGFRGSKFVTDRRIVNFAGVQVDNLSMSEAVQRIEAFIQSGQPHLVVTPNPEIIVSAQADTQLRDIINQADLRTADGISMVVVSRLLGCPLQERVSGIDLMVNLLALAEKKGYKVFFLGSAPGVAEAAGQRLQERFPGLKIVGIQDGYFKEGDDAKIIATITSVQPDLLFVGLGGGRQEKWLQCYRNELKVPVAMVIGGSLDVLSGKKHRAPKWIQKLYIEWLYRLITEPRRWKRQLALPKFLWLMFFGR